jgi:hypothetical protein
MNAFAVLFAWFLDWRLARHLAVDSDGNRQWRGEDDGAETLIRWIGEPLVIEGYADLEGKGRGWARVVGP